jgi:hypothetical protein
VPKVFGHCDFLLYISCKTTFFKNIIPKSTLRLLYPQNLNGLEHSIEKLYQSRHLFVQNIFLDGKPTERNPHPMLKLGYENKATPGRRKLLRKHLVSKKPRIDKADQLDDDTSIQSVSAPTVFGLCFIYSPSLL